MIYILIYIDRKTAISSGHFQCGDILVEVNPSDFSMQQREELYQLRSRKIDINSSDRTQYYDLTGRIYETSIEFNEQTITINESDIETIYTECPFPTIGTTDKESISSLLDSSIARRQFISTYLDKK